MRAEVEGIGGSLTSFFEFLGFNVSLGLEEMSFRFSVRGFFKFENLLSGFESVGRFLGSERGFREQSPDYRLDFLFAGGNAFLEKGPTFLMLFRFGEIGTEPGGDGRRKRGVAIALAEEFDFLL